METFPRYWPFVGEFTGHRWRRALMFYLICEQINTWVNNHDDVDLRHHHANYDVIVMLSRCMILTNLKATFVSHSFHDPSMVIMWYSPTGVRHYRVADDPVPNRLFIIINIIIIIIIIIIISLLLLLLLCYCYCYRYRYRYCYCYCYCYIIIIIIIIVIVIIILQISRSDHSSPNISLQFEVPMHLTIPCYDIILLYKG